MTHYDPFVENGSEAESRLDDHDKGIRTAEATLELLREEREEWLTRPVTNGELTRFAFMVRDSMRRQAIESITVSRFGVTQIEFVGGRQLTVPHPDIETADLVDWRNRYPTYGVLEELLEELGAPEALIATMIARADGVLAPKDGGD